MIRGHFIAPITNKGCYPGHAARHGQQVDAKGQLLAEQESAVKAIIEQAELLCKVEVFLLIAF